MLTRRPACRPARRHRCGHGCWRGRRRRCKHGGMAWPGGRWGGGWLRRAARNPRRWCVRQGAYGGSRGRRETTQADRLARGVVGCEPELRVSDVRGWGKARGRVELGSWNGTADFDVGMHGAFRRCEGRSNPAFRLLRGSLGLALRLERRRSHVCWLSGRARDWGTWRGRRDACWRPGASGIGEGISFPMCERRQICVRIGTHGLRRDGRGRGELVDLCRLSGYSLDLSRFLGRSPPEGCASSLGVEVQGLPFVVILGLFIDPPPLQRTGAGPYRLDWYVRYRPDRRELAFVRKVAHLNAEFNKYSGIAFYCCVVCWYLRSATGWRGDVQVFGYLRLCYVRRMWLARGACGLRPALRTHRS